MWPWLRWCSNYRYASQLVALALEDIKDMSEDDFKWAFGWCHDYDEIQSHRSSARSGYIAHIERWHEDDIEQLKWSIDYMAKELDRDGAYFEGRTPEEQFEHEWKLKQQKKAVVVLYAYNMFNKRTGQIELDRLKKLR